MSLAFKNDCIFGMENTYFLILFLNANIDTLGVKASTLKVSVALFTVKNSFLFYIIISIRHTSL